MGSQRFHIAIYPRHFEGMTDKELEKTFGKPAKEIRSYLAECRVKKYMIPMADCDNFDPKTGCGGHAVEEEAK